ncbi:MAG: OmpA family protein [Paludibacteraceae bacterium]|jgi:outer membrane protein OmpA-like peptidoglycan-associated protein|nr:OmpA family protein [Paludibacteraceae bacterium]
MPSKVRVYGKAQNRTALGIVNAYLVMYPHATKEDLEKAFPLELQPKGTWNSLFRTETEYNEHVANQGLWFGEKDERLKLQDGSEVIFLKLWPKDKFENIVNHAKQYDIEIAEFTEGVKGEKGGFRLEYLNGYVPPVPVVSTGMPMWLKALIGILVLAIIALLLWLFLRKPETQVVEKVVEIEKVVVVRDTVFVQQIAEIEKNFNAANFKQGVAELSEDAKFVLHDLAKILNAHENVTLKIQGHTSAEGDPAYNQKLSEERAKAAVDFLVEREGVDVNQLSYEGLGSSSLKNTEDPMAAENRRTEFIIVE